MSLSQLARRLKGAFRERHILGLLSLGHRIIPDYRFTWHRIDWWKDPEFNLYLERFGERRGCNTHRRWMVWQLLRLVAEVPGDTAECGVYEGSSSWLICAGTRGSGRTHHLFDSFEGLSAPVAADGGYWVAGDLSAQEEVARRNLVPFEDSLVFHKGWIPARFDEVKDKRFAFVHVDVDLAEPTRDSIQFFYPRLSPGAVLVCDDYGSSMCPGATAAVDEFLADKPEKMLALDAGGGFLIKGIATAPPRQAIP
jgi:hypothetical protein